MWCKACNIETNDDVCPICGANTVEDIPTEVYCGAAIVAHRLFKKKTKPIRVSALFVLL